MVSSMFNIICFFGSDILLMQVVDFVVDDGCGNFILEQVIFIVIDNMVFIFVECLEDEVIGINFGQCFVNYILEVFFIQEECVSLFFVVNLFDNVMIIFNVFLGQEVSVFVNFIVLLFLVSQLLFINV